MLKDLLLHPKTKKQAEMFIKRPSTPLLITAPSGSGKGTLARAISASVLGLKDVASLDSYPYFLQVARNGSAQNISIDEARSIIRFLKLKAPGRGRLRRGIFFEDAQDFCIEVRNAHLGLF